MLELKNVSKHFGGVRAVDELSITVRQGARISLLSRGISQNCVIFCRKLHFGMDSGFLFAYCLKHR